jgi:hypothetical protein
MRKKIYSVLMLLFVFTFGYASEEDYLKINARIEPSNIKQGEEGALKIKITPKTGIKISSHPEFMIRLDKSNDFSFPKLFFTASELDFQTNQENEAVFLDLEKEVNILFKVNENSLIGNHTISGEVVFTAVFKDNWSLKTYQRFTVDFFSLKNQKTKTKKK